MEIEGRSIIVTGGARGIGLVAARTLLERGARVTVVARSAESIAEARDALGDSGLLATVAADASTQAGAESIAKQAIESFGGIDVLFTNAGAYAEASIEDTDIELWDTVMDANLKSCALCIRACIAQLRKSRGAIVTMSSFNGVTGISGGVSAYGAAKAAVISLTRSLALDLAPEVRVNCIAPGFVETEKLLARPDADTVIDALSQMTPVGRIARREEIAHALVFAIENDFLNGATVNIDGGRCAGA
jgi:3-oxoacyl-[acyl-carrier protein] reductase